MTSPRLVSANRNPALPDGVPRYAHLFGPQSERRLASCTGPFSPQPLSITDPFCMETAASVRDAIRQGDYVTSLDLPDAYLHILIHRRNLRWIRFVWQGRAGQSVSVLGAPLRPFLGESVSSPTSRQAPQSAVPEGVPRPLVPCRHDVR